MARQKAEKLTDKQEIAALRKRVRELESVLKELHKKTYHYPNSDYYEYCNGCGQSPYAAAYHNEGCLVVKVCDVLFTKKK